MQEHIIYLDAHESVAVVRDEKNMRTLPPPTLVRGTACVLKLRLFAERIGTTPFPIANLYDVVSWQWAMDSDFCDRSPHKLVADSANIELNSVQEFRDGIGRAYTQITIPMPSMETGELARWLGSEPVRAGLTGELTGFDATGSPIYILQIEGFKIRNRIVASAAPPTSSSCAVPGITMEQLQQMINQAIINAGGNSSGGNNSSSGSGGNNSSSGSEENNSSSGSGGNNSSSGSGGNNSSSGSGGNSSSGSGGNNSSSGSGAYENETGGAISDDITYDIL
ncbi:MAG: hypothetical protein J6Y26_03650 [Lachnospiraceae bacterium]|nr:hypothetical protein [Lachnospiraceae bacterium]